MKTNDGAIDIRPGRHCGRLWQVPVRQEQQREQHASDKGEVSTKGHAHHRVTTKPRGSLVQRGVTANVPVARPCRSDREKVEHPVLPRVADGIAKKPEEDTLKKFLMIGALAFAATTVAQTAMAAEFYVVRDATTKKCTVVESKPTSTTTTVVDNGIYKTKTEAETGMKTTKVCTE